MASRVQAQDPCGGPVSSAPQVALLAEGSLAAPALSSHGAPCLAFPLLAARGHALAPLSSLLSRDQETLGAAPTAFLTEDPARRPLFPWLPNPIRSAEEFQSRCSVTEPARGEITEGKRSKHLEDRASAARAGHRLLTELGAGGSLLATERRNKCALTSRTGSAVN